MGNGMSFAMQPTGFPACIGNGIFNGALPNPPIRSRTPLSIRGSGKATPILAEKTTTPDVLNDTLFINDSNAVGQGIKKNLHLSIHDLLLRVFHVSKWEVTVFTRSASTTGFL